MSVLDSVSCRLCSLVGLFCCRKITYADTCERLKMHQNI